MYKRIETELSGLNIGILINNAGMSYPHAQYLDKLDNKLVEDLININVVALTKLTKIVLPGMVLFHSLSSSFLLYFFLSFAPLIFLLIFNFSIYKK